MDSQDITTLNQFHVQELTTDDLNSATLAHTHDLQNERPLDNFPLPLELRNQIYSYLLDAEYTRVDRRRVGDRAYKFQTSILGVNRRIHDEAEEYLYKRNVFIVVTHQSSKKDFKTMISAAPWVAELHGVEFNHRLLDVHLSDLPYGHPRQFKIPESTWLFLSTDLKHYRLFASLLLSSGRFKRAPLLVLRGDGELSDCFVNSKGRGRSPYHLRLEFRSHRYRKATSEIQGSLLASMSPLQCPGLLVSISGKVLDHDSTRDTSMDPNLLCNSAISWHLLHVWDRIQAIVDASIIENEPTIAAHVFREILTIAEGRRPSPSWLSYEIRLALFQFRLNMAYAMVYMQRIMQNPTEFAKAVSGVLQIVGHPNGTGPADPYTFHLHMLAFAVCPSEKSLPPFPQITIAECIARLPTSRRDHQYRDVRILKKCAQNKIFSPDDLPAASCSFSAARMSKTGFGELVEMPDHISGFLDLRLLRGLDKGKKEQINKLQAERGWSITRFEEFDNAGSHGGSA